MNIGDLLKSLGTKAATTLGSLLTPFGGKAQAPAAPSPLISVPEKTMADYFAPAPNKVRIRDVARETPGAALDIAKMIGAGAARFGLSTGEAIPQIPLDVASMLTHGQSPQIPIMKPEPLPGPLSVLGPIESYQNEARRRAAQGEAPGAAAAKTFGQALLDEPTGIAAKPALLAAKPLGLALAGFLKGGGAKETEQVLSALVKADTPEKAGAILTKAGMAPEQVTAVAPKIAQAGTRDEVNAVLKGSVAPAPKIAPVKPTEATAGGQTLPETAPKPVNPADHPFKIGDAVKIESKNPLEKGKVTYGIVHGLDGGSLPSLRTSGKEIGPGIKVYPTENPMFGGSTFRYDKYNITKTNLTPEQTKAIDAAGQQRHVASEDMVQTGKKYVPISQRTLGKPAPPIFKGFTDLSTKTLEKLKGRSEVSRQYITDIANQPDLKQAERDAIRQTLAETQGDTIPVQEFADKVKTKLLPLGRSMDITGQEHGIGAGYENITLPDNLRGPIANYSEHVYQSPIKTSGGDVHYGSENVPGYFAHVRVEDLPTNTSLKIVGHKFPDGSMKYFVDDIGTKNQVRNNPFDTRAEAQQYIASQPTDATRRVIEIQSDLFQKGRLENEQLTIGRQSRTHLEDQMSPEDRNAFKEAMNSQTNDIPSNAQHYATISNLEDKYFGKMKQTRADELAKLEPYRNTWWQRIIREETKQAATDGKTTLQFPTGETAMKIEGLGGQTTHWTDPTSEATLLEKNLSKGMRINDGNSDWIITDVLGDGKFKAVPKNIMESMESYRPTSNTFGETPDAYVRRQIDARSETFDISGKVDTANPIYQFYEKDIGRFLQKQGAKKITDAQGVTWWQLGVNQALKNAPVEAFGVAAGFETDPQTGKVKFDPAKAAMGFALAMGAKKISPDVLKQLEALGTKLMPMAEKAIETLAAITKSHPEIDQIKLLQHAQSIAKLAEMPEISPSAVLEAAQYATTDIGHINRVPAAGVLSGQGAASYMRAKQIGIEGLDPALETLSKSIAQKAKGLDNKTRSTLQAIIDRIIVKDKNGDIGVPQMKKIDTLLTRAAKDAKARGEGSIQPVNILSAAHDMKLAVPTAEKAPKVSRETPKGTAGTKSVAEILQGGGGEKPPVPRETATGPIPNQQPERQFSKRAGEMTPELQPLITGKYAARDTKGLVAEADALIKSDPAEAMRVGLTDTSERGVAVASRLIDNLTGQAKVATDEATKTALYEKAANVANEAARNLTEHGRAVQAATILGKLTPEGMVRWAAGEIQKYNEKAGGRTLRNFLGGAKKIPELTGEQTKHIADEMQKIIDMTDTEQKAQAYSKLQKEVKALIPSSLYQKIIALWKAGLLTGIKTSGLNVMSNISHGVSEVAKDVPAALVDKVASLFTGKRTVAITGKGIVGGTGEGIAKGWRFFRTGYDERDALGKLDYHAVNFGKGRIAKALQTYEETVFSTLGAEDQPFYYGAKAHSLYSQAIATAKNEGLKGAERAARVNELVANPPDDMLKYAVMDAQTAVFQNETALGKVAKALQRAPGGEVILPFGRTPASVATQLINYTPVGIVKTIIENIGKGRFDQRLLSQGIGRGLTGTGVLAIGAALYGAGLVTTGRPTSEKEQKQWQIEGKQPYALYIGGQWRNLGILGPLGMVLGVGASMRQGFDETGSFVGGLGAAAASAGGTLTQQTFLYGINQAINALNDPAHYGATFIRNLVGSVVPTIIADVARATDTYERQANTAGQRISSRIPGMRELLQPQVDVLGAKIKTPDFLTVMADPTRPYIPTEALNDPVVVELRRLDAAGYNSTPTLIGGTSGFKSLTDGQNNRLRLLSGEFSKQAIQKEMANPQYGKWDDEKKSSEIGSKITDAKTEARAKVVFEATQGLTGDALAKRLSTLKDDKVLTKAVFTRYNELKRFGK